MRIIVSGASGFIGRHLLPWLEGQGHTVVPMVRNRHRHGIFWDPVAGEIDAEQLEGSDAIINLAGESVAERWSAHKKERIFGSRVAGTDLLATAISNLRDKPSTFLCASAIGYYGNRGSEILTEDSDPGNTFLSRVCVEWEAATEPATAAGVRTVNLRFGIVMSTTGGAFHRLLVPFKMGAGGRLGSGQQYMSWITMDDTLNAITFILQRSLSGPVNVVAPNPVTNEELTETLGHLLQRPARMPVSPTMAHLAFGREMADEVLLASDRVLPERLTAEGFSFAFPQLEPALRHLLKDHL